MASEYMLKATVKIDENSQITLPKMFFEALQLGPKDEFIAEVMNGQIILTPKTDTELILESPPTKNIEEIIAQMRATGRYSKEFLTSLKDRLLDSCYFSEEDGTQKIAKQARAVTDLFIQELERYEKLQGIYVSLDKSFYHIIFDVLDDDETTLRRIVDIDTEARRIAPDLSIDLLFCDFNEDPDLKEATLIDHEQVL
ncbi:AbrB/MazE/SpoVT family DNA-binding domain-containing protein [Candidatus Poribacteria bacterium]|nr:AbrB/MazE/SpoVT family DNA-binding domain-containing protein [Candidatus Poribacteria bacterium]